MECKTCKKVFILKRTEIGAYCSEECRQSAYNRVNHNFWGIEFTEFDEFVKAATDYYYRCEYITRSSSIWASWVNDKIKDGELKGVPTIDDFFQKYLQWLSDAWSKRKEQEKSSMLNTMRERGSQYHLEESQRHRKLEMEAKREKEQEEERERDEERIKWEEEEDRIRSLEKGYYQGDDEIL